MQHLSNQESIIDNVSVNAHHDVLSAPKKQSKGLLDHLQTGIPNPLDLLLAGGAENAILDNVTLQPAQTGVEIEPDDQPKSMILGAACPLSKSLLWKMQEDYYCQLEINAWQDGVPNFITSSTYIAESYAEIVLSFIEDYYEHLDLSEPLYIVELATGAGRFSYLMLRELERKMACFSKFRNVQLKYVMTDFTGSNPDFWQTNKGFKPFVEKGMLDFGVYNPLVANSIELRESKMTLSSETVKNPVIAIANYFFDSIPVDVFRVESKVLKEGLVTLERNLEGVDPASAPHISQITTSYQYKELFNTNYYTDSSLNAILNHYRHNIKNGTILFPVGAFQVIQNLKEMTNNQVVLISSDKSYTCPEDMIRYYQHEFATHSGAFSYMVNYDAIGHYFKNEGGRFFCTTGKNYSIQTVCCIEMNQPDSHFERLQYVFKEKIDRSAPANALCATMPGKDISNPVAHMNYMLAELRLNLAEPRVLFGMAQALIDTLPHALKGQQEDLLKLMDEAMQCYYYYPGECNVPFWLSQVYHQLQRFEDSLSCLDRAIEDFGEHEVLFFLKGQNYERLSQWQLAKEMYEKAVALKSDFPEAWEALNNVEAKLK